MVIFIIHANVQQQVAFKVIVIARVHLFDNRTIPSNNHLHYGTLVELETFDKFHDKKGKVGIFDTFEPMNAQG